MTRYFDRSRREDWEHCPRKRYLGYEHGGWGVSRVVQSIPQVTGSLIHAPLAEVLTAVKSVGRAAVEGIPLIIKAHADKYRKQVTEQGVFADYFDGSDETAGQVVKEVNWQVDEQVALLEALVMGWAGIRLPEIVKEFEILDVEREERYKFPDSDLVLLARCDAVLRHRETHEVYVLNFKTTSDANSTWRSQWNYDQQTISEVVAVEQRLNERVSGVLIEGLVKGRRNVQYPRDSGQWRHNSPLIYGWKQDNPPFTEYACQYEYKDELGKTRRLGKGYERFFVPEEMSLREWLTKLYKEHPQVLRAQFVNLPAILRSDAMVESWKQATLSEENTIKQRKVWLETGDSIDTAFPMHTGHGNCLRPGKCEFFDVCHGMADPDDETVFKRRVANHPEENVCPAGGEAVSPTLTT